MKVPFLKGGLEFCLRLLQEVWTEDAKANLKEEKKKRKRKRKKKIRHNLLNSHNLTINNFYVNQNLIIVTEIWIEKIKA